MVIGTGLSQRSWSYTSFCSVCSLVQILRGGIAHEVHRGYIVTIISELMALDHIFLALLPIYVCNLLIEIIGLTWLRFRRSFWAVYSLGIISLSTCSLSSFLPLTQSIAREERSSSESASNLKILPNNYPILPHRDNTDFSLSHS